MTRIAIRLSNSLREILEVRAHAKKIPLSEFIRQSLEKQTSGDIEIQNELVDTLGQLRSEILNIKREVNIFSSMFIYWLRFYFTLAGQEFDAIPEGAARQVQFKKGDERRDKFLAMYKRDNTNMRTLFEQLFADFLTEEQGTKSSDIPEKK